jgi:hypothetical protein
MSYDAINGQSNGSLGSDGGDGGVPNLNMPQVIPDDLEYARR